MEKKCFLLEITICFFIFQKQCDVNCEKKSGHWIQYANIEIWILEEKTDWAFLKCTNGSQTFIGT